MSDDDFGEFEDFQTKIHPLKSANLVKISDEEIRAQLVKPPKLTPNPIPADTSTSHQLFDHLTETLVTPIPKFEGSPIHRQLALALGVPLNLDSLSKPQVQRLDLPTQKPNEDELISQVPEWNLLSQVSLEALEHKTSTELELHLTKLQSALENANKLKEQMESQEMDLMGEKHILEGMVESLLVFSQRKHREMLQRRH